MKTILMVTAACLAVAATADAKTPTPVRGGTAVVATEQGPPCLNTLAGACNSSAAVWMTENTLLGAYHVTPDLTYEPMLVERTEIVHHPSARHPFSVTYHVRPDAVWSDGVPVSSDDFIFTADVMRNPADNVADRTGYDAIAEAVKVDDKTVTFSFDRPFAAWKTLFAPVLPEHVLAGTNFNTAFADGVADPVTHAPIGDGPYLVASFVPGQSLTLVRNPRWWGAHAPYLDSVVLRFPNDIASEVAAVTSGDADLIVPSGGAQLMPLTTTPGVVLDQAPGLFQEHLDFHVASATQPLLGQAWFRQAVAYAIDRPAVARAVWGALSPDIQPLQSLVSFAGQRDYTPDFSVYAYDPAQVAALMTAHNCVRGADAIWSCGGMRASIGITVNTAQGVRLEEEALMQAEARSAGIELVAQNLPPGVIFGPAGIPGGFYDSAVYAWVVGPDPSWSDNIYRCGGTSNYLGYCSAAVTSLLDASLQEPNANKRTNDLTDADALLAQDVPSIPLFQRPAFVAYRTTLHGIVNEVSVEGPFWNLADWWKG
jgi:peptide/nickel transport system substrate-binding protein